MANDDDSHISAFLMGFRRVRGFVLKRFDISSKVLTYIALQQGPLGAHCVKWDDAISAAGYASSLGKPER